MGPVGGWMIHFRQHPIGPLATAPLIDLIDLMGTVLPVDRVETCRIEPLDWRIDRCIPRVLELPIYAQMRQIPGKKQQSFFYQGQFDRIQHIEHQQLRNGRFRYRFGK
jgi:hypothetical protein